MNSPRIISLEWGRVEAERPRAAGSNARLGEHGSRITMPILRLLTNDDTTGFGVCNANRESAGEIVGKSLESLFDPAAGILDPWLTFEFPIWDLMGQRVGKPVYSLAAEVNNKTVTSPFSAPCYDTSLYFDDLHIEDNGEAAALIASEASTGYSQGHRAFKIKIGRGARHLPHEQGTARDIAIIHAVRRVIGPESKLMLDANNGLNLNLTKRILTETADCNIFWMEEAFHEDPVLYRELKAWMKSEGLGVLIADGEGEASTSLLRWAKEGLIDVAQYDIFGHGFTRWLETGRQLDEWKVLSAPHHYGGFYGNYASAHLAGAIEGFAFAEWDDAASPALDTSAYSISNGRIAIPDAPGFGLKLDEECFQRAVAENGYALALC